MKFFAEGTSPRIYRAPSPHPPPYDDGWLRRLSIEDQATAGQVTGVCDPVGTIPTLPTSATRHSVRPPLTADQVVGRWCEVDHGRDRLRHRASA